jgi:hypothetical protein
MDDRDYEAMNRESWIKISCKKCNHWKSGQAELEYSTHYGICTCFKWKFSTGNEGDALLLDRQNRTDKHMGVNRFESQSNKIPFGQVDKSRYCFVTEEKFGCIHFDNTVTS